MRANFFSVKKEYKKRGKVARIESIRVVLYILDLYFRLLIHVSFSLLLIYTIFIFILYYYIKR